MVTMKVWQWLVFVFLVVFLFGYLGFVCTRPACASPLDCEGLHNADQRNYCRALTRHEPNYCEVIRDPNVRLTCRALVRK